MKYIKNHYLIILNSIFFFSSFLFIILSKRLIFDDINNLRDILRYNSEGLTIETIKNHINPAAPLSYIIISLIGTLFGAKLWSWRLAVLLGWIILYLSLALNKNLQKKSNAIFFVITACFYSATASASILTEIYGLVFLTLGIIYYFFLNRKDNNNEIFAFLFFGLAIICRQYYLCLIPALFFTEFNFKQFKLSNRPFIVFIKYSLILLPIILLFLLWGGLTSPSLKSFASYTNVNTLVSFNPIRILPPIIYIGIYLGPLYLIHYGLGKNKKTQLYFLIFASLIAIIFVLNNDYFYRLGNQEQGTGPLDSIGAKLNNNITLKTFLFLTYTSGFYFFIYLVNLLKSLINNPFQKFTLFFILFFVLENIGIGGNISFYERYILQLMPVFAISLILVNNFKKHLFILLTLTFLIGQLMLWRHL